MAQSAVNLRVRRTQTLLRDALIELTEEKGFETLTIGEITERAMVSRAAFYRNYHDKYDLVERIFDEAMSALRNEVTELGQQHPAATWVAFFKHIARYQRLYRALLGGKGSLWFARKVRATLADLIVERGRIPHGAEAGAHITHNFSDTFVPDMVAALFVEAITWWLDHGQPYTPEQMATRTARLAASVFSETSSW